MSEDMQYRVVSVDDEGNQTATVPFDNAAYAEKLWLRANTLPSVARCWVERRPMAPWEVCSSETGRLLMETKPGA